MTVELGRNSKTCLRWPLKRRPIIALMQVQGSILQYFRPSFSYHLSFKIFVLSIFEWPLKTGLSVLHLYFNSFHSDRFPIHIDTISMDLSILYLKGS